MRYFILTAMLVLLPACEKDSKSSSEDMGLDAMTAGATAGAEAGATAGVEAGAEAGATAGVEAGAEG